MKKKTFWKVLTMLLVLVLSVGILAACKEKKEPEKPGEIVPPETTSVPEHTAFFDTMFGSANELGDSAVDLSEGKNIALNVGLSLGLSVGSNKLPIGISVKGLIDRKNVRVTSFVKDGANVKTGKWVWCNDYIAYDEAKHAGWERFKLDNEAYLPDANGELVKKIVEYNKATAAHNAATAVRYKGTSFALTSANETVIDICLNVQGVDSLRVYYEMGDTAADVDTEARGIMFVTLAGNKFKIDLNAATDADNGLTTKVEDTLYNFIETKFLGNNLIQSIIGSFGENFDLNKMISGMLLPVIKNIQVEGNPLVPAGKTLADVLLDNNGLGGKELAGMKVSTIVTQIFGSADNVKNYLGETLDIQSILKQASKMLFNSPKWTAYNASGAEITKPTNSYDLVKENLKQKLKAEIQLGGSLGSKAEAMTFLDGPSSLTLGFIKDAGTGDNVGKMDSLYIDLFLSKINGSKNIDIKISIDDLAFGTDTASVGMTKMSDAEKTNYGAFTFDAGMELSLPEDFLSIAFRREDKASAGFDTFTDSDYEVVLGENNGGNTLVSADGKTVYIPNDIVIEMKGALDFASPKGTKVVLNVIAKAYNAEAGNADFKIATAQLYPAADGKTLIFDVKAYDTKLVPFIMDLLANQSNIINNTGDLNGFTKYNGEWGWWHDGKELINLADGFTEHVKSAAITSGVYYSKSVDGKTYTKIVDVNTINDGEKIYKLNDNLAVTTTSTNYVAVRKGGNYYGAQFYYKEKDGIYAVDEADYEGQLYILKTAYAAAAAQDTITELYKNGKVCYASSSAVNNFVKTGEMRVTGINIYNLLFMNKSISQIFIDEYYYLGNEGYDLATAAEAGNGSWDFLKTFLLATNRDKGIISVIGSLLNYDKTNGVTIGGDNVLDTLFGAKGVFSFNKEGFTANVFSVLGHLVEPSNNNIISNYYKTESSLQDLANRGIEVYGGLNPYIRIDRNQNLVSAGEKLLAEWENGTTTTERKAAIVTELEKLGYKLINTNDTTAELYPLFLYNNNVSVWTTEYITALAKGQYDVIKNKKSLLTNEGFNVEEITKEAYEANSKKFGYFSQTTYNTSGVATTKYVRLTGRSVETLVAEWKAAEAAAQDTSAIRKALFRRGIATRKYQDSNDAWQYYTAKVVIDEAMLVNADATVQIYTKKDATNKVITNAGIKVTIGYCNTVSTLNLFMNFQPASVTMTDGKVNNDSIGFVDNLLTNPVENTFEIQIVANN